MSNPDNTNNDPNLDPKNQGAQDPQNSNINENGVFSYDYKENMTKAEIDNILKKATLEASKKGASERSKNIIPEILSKANTTFQPKTLADVAKLLNEYENFKTERQKNQSEIEQELDLVKKKSNNNEIKVKEFETKAQTYERLYKEILTENEMRKFLISNGATDDEDTLDAFIGKIRKEYNVQLEPDENSSNRLVFGRGITSEKLAIEEFKNRFTNLFISRENIKLAAGAGSQSSGRRGTPTGGELNKLIETQMKKHGYSK